MMIFRKAIPRRTFLRGAGTTLALPLLDAMVPAFAATTDAKPTARLCTVYVANGRIMEKWIPTATGDGFEMTPTLAPLEPFRNQLLVLSGLDIKAADARPGEGGAGHARAAGAFLTGVHPAPGGALGISVDQVAAREFGKQTPLASLEIGLDATDNVGGGDGNYAAYYSNTISWRSGTQPLPMENNPRAVFERLFGDSDTADPAERLRRIQTNRSILDSISERAARLMGLVSTTDRMKFTEYLDSVRDVERRIQVAEELALASKEKSSSQGAVSMERPAGIPPTYREHAKLMADLQVLAFRTDITRVITFMLGKDSTDRPFPEIGVGDSHHALSHHKEVEETKAVVAQIDLFQSELVAYFLDKLRSTQDGEGSLLDHSVVVYGSSLSNGNWHVHNDVPIAVVGGGTGKIKGGRHIRYEGLPLSNLFLAVLDLIGVPDTSYRENKESDMTGKLEGLTG